MTDFGGRFRKRTPILFLGNWLGGTLSGPKRSIFRHISPIFLTVAAQRSKKSASTGKKWPLYVSDATTPTSYVFRTKPLTMSRFSLIALFLSGALLVASSIFYYPKWQKADTEATISWDVSGYYLYLPAAIVYQDIKELKWWGAIEQQYHPGPGMGQAFKHPSGNYVLKYPMGQALQFLPWFLTAHVLAEPLGYPADGFSRPYQAAISWGSLVVALLGLWFLRRVLLLYFSDGIVASVLVLLVFGSNYLEYAGITGAMTHNWLFTLYSILLFSTIHFYRRPTFGWAALIGLLVGWAVLTRPTEIIAAMIPIFWGVHSMATLRQRITFFKAHFFKAILAASIAGSVIFLQLLYWKYASGEWLVYSYEGQGFTWFPPHIEDVMWSARAGWLVYSPAMIFAVVGLFMLRRRLPAVFPTVLVYCLTALYITSAWDIWWYGGSLGQRAMVQTYPLWAFGIAAFISWQSQKIWRRWVFLVGVFIGVYLNLWWSHQAHRGGLFLGEQMTRRYVIKILGRYEVERDWLKLLDTKEAFQGDARHNVQEAFSDNFDLDSTDMVTAVSPIRGAKSLVLDQDHPFSPEFELPEGIRAHHWLRASITFRCQPKEWEWWAMTQFVVRFKQGDKIIKDRMIRLQRHVDGSEEKRIFFDTKIPTESFDRATIYLWNSGSNKTILLDDLQVETFD
jgi:hypothetical protein